MSADDIRKTADKRACCSGPMAMRCHPDSARAILDRRYAAGELTKEEYESIKSDLERRPS